MGKYTKTLIALLLVGSFYNAALLYGNTRTSDSLFGKASTYAEESDFNHSQRDFMEAYTLATLSGDTLGQYSILERVAFTSARAAANNSRDSKAAIAAINTFINHNVANLSHRVYLLDLLCKYLKSQRSFELASTYQNLLLTTKQEVFHESYLSLTDDSRAYEELIENEKALIDNELRIKATYAIVIILIFIIIAVIKRFIDQSKKEKQKKHITLLELSKERAEKTLLENSIKEQELFAQLEQERSKKEQDKLEREVKNKNNELISRALFMANRNRFVSELMQTISETENYSDNPSLKKISEKLHEQINANQERESFFAYFHEYNAAFIDALKREHTKLTVAEIRFVCLIYMDLNMKEIASLLNLSAEYCKKRRQQIAHKMGLESTSHLYSYLFEVAAHNKRCAYQPQR